MGVSGLAGPAHAGLAFYVRLGSCKFLLDTAQEQS